MSGYKYVGSERFDRIEGAEPVEATRAPCAFLSVTAAAAWQRGIALFRRRLDESRSSRPDKCDEFVALIRALARSSERAVARLDTIGT
jgi:hypothetical protein